MESKRTRNKQFRKRYGRGRAQKQICIVYALSDELGDIRYVGQTRCQPERRFKFHMRDARLSPERPLSRWLLEEPRQITVLDDNATWDVSEIIWIDRLRSAGLDLFNQLRGGTDSMHALQREGAETGGDWWNQFAK